MQRRRRTMPTQGVDRRIAAHSKSPAACLLPGRRHHLGQIQSRLACNLRLRPRSADLELTVVTGNAKLRKKAFAFITLERRCSGILPCKWIRDCLRHNHDRSGMVGFLKKDKIVPHCRKRVFPRGIRSVVKIEGEWNIHLDAGHFLRRTCNRNDSHQQAKGYA